MIIKIIFTFCCSYDSSSNKNKIKQYDKIITISSDDVTPSGYPVTLSENILNRLYGDEFEEFKDEIFPQSEPKRKPVKDTVIRRPPRSEMYEIFHKMCYHVVLMFIKIIILYEIL